MDTVLYVLTALIPRITMSNKMTGTSSRPRRAEGA